MLTFILIVVLVCCTVYLGKEINVLKEVIKDIQDQTKKEPDYSEHSAISFSIYSTFRIVPFVRSDGKMVYDVQYRNPADTKWKVCRCEETEEKAVIEMQKIIDRTKGEEIV